MKKYFILVILLIFASCQKGGGDANSERNAGTPKGEAKVATFAGGCFWCTEADFEKVPGVIIVISGYTGGQKKNPTYEEVSSGITGHLEAVNVYYDSSRVTYEALLDYFWRHIDPTDPKGQFVDRGLQYRSAIFYRTDVERKAAEKTKKRLAESGTFKAFIATDILPFTIFYEAEEYHQDYYRKHSLKYKFYRQRSGRDQFLRKVWGGEVDRVEVHGEQKYTKPEKAELKRKLTPLQYKVTQEEGTEPSFKNEYWDEKRAGIYVDIVSGEPLFSSLDKYDSGTGWPSFTRPLEPGNIVEKEDRRLFTKRIEVRSRKGDSHLGHVFDDGPPPAGLRYCMNSAALRFIPEKDLEREGYGQYLHLFQKK